MKILAQITGGLGLAVGLFFLLASFGPWRQGDDIMVIALAVGTIASSILILCAARIIGLLEELLNERRP